MPWQSVIEGTERFSVEPADCLRWLGGLPENSVDLIFGSPPYEDARLYGELGFKLKGQAWVDWMVEVYKAGLRACTGLVAFVVGHGKFGARKWSAAPALLAADLHRAGIMLRNPPIIYYRVGIPGSGQNDWLRADYEWIICAHRGGKLPHANNTACGHPPKYAPGGEMSYRLTDGTRRNQWGGGARSGGQRRRSGQRQKPSRPSHELQTKREAKNQQSQDEAAVEVQAYKPPAIANPGNVVQCVVGGNKMGHELAAQNEAPFPEQLSDFFVQSFTAVGDTVADCFTGSGTTGASSVKYHRKFIGCDLRPGQVAIAERRIGETNPLLPFLVEGSAVNGDES